MHIRPYQNYDRDAVVALWNEVLPDSAPHNDPATSIRLKLEVDRDLLLVAHEAGEIVGTAMGGYDGHRGWIYSVAVKGKYRRCGFGRSLLAQIEAALVKRGCLKVNLQVRASNAEVIEFYRAIGYSIEDRISMGKCLYR